MAHAVRSQEEVTCRVKTGWIWAHIGAVAALRSWLFKGLSASLNFPVFSKCFTVDTCYFFKGKSNQDKAKGFPMTGYWALSLCFNWTLPLYLHLISSPPVMSQAMHFERLLSHLTQNRRWLINVRQRATRNTSYDAKHKLWPLVPGFFVETALRFSLQLPSNLEESFPKLEVENSYFNEGLTVISVLEDRHDWKDAKVSGPQRTKLKEATSWWFQMWLSMILTPDRNLISSGCRRNVLPGCRQKGINQHEVCMVWAPVLLRWFLIHRSLSGEGVTAIS